MSLDGLSRLSVETNSRPYGQNRRRYGAKQNFAERSNRMNRTYEIMFIVRPDVEEADLDKLIEGFSANVTNGGGEVKTVEKMGRRRLAYTVRKFNDGFYVLLTIAAAGSLIAEIERRLRVSEQVIKFITVRMDEEEKRLAKVKALRSGMEGIKLLRVAESERAAEMHAGAFEGWLGLDEMFDRSNRHDGLRIRILLEG